jgi:hypothetical protein
MGLPVGGPSRLAAPACAAAARHKSSNAAEFKLPSGTLLVLSSDRDVGHWHMPSDKKAASSQAHASCVHISARPVADRMLVRQDLKGSGLRVNETHRLSLSVHGIK